MPTTRFPQGILVSCEVPWDERDQLLVDVFRTEVRRALAAGLRNVYVFGTAGEGYAVDTARFRDVVQVFREETARPDVLAQVGVIAFSTVQYIERLAIAYDAGFRIFQLSLPSWAPLNDAELVRFFRDVCGAFPDSRFLHYNLARSKRILSAADYRTLIDAVPNLVATKNTKPTPRETAALLRHAGELQHFFAEEQFAIGCLSGECSLLSSSGKLFPRRAQEFFELGRTRQFDRLFPMLHEYLAGIDEFLLEPTAGLGLIDGAYDKAMVRLSGLDFPLRLLSPYNAMPEAIYERCREILHARYADWLG